MSYEVACKALRQDLGGLLHIHGNARGDWKIWSTQIETEIGQILGNQWTTEQVHIEDVKSFAPRVHHLVLDLKCIPIIKGS